MAIWRLKTPNVSSHTIQNQSILAARVLSKNVPWRSWDSIKMHGDVALPTLRQRFLHILACQDLAAGLPSRLPSCLRGIDALPRRGATPPDIKS
jgi:hypothetical protein